MTPERGKLAPPSLSSSDRATVPDLPRWALRSGRLRGSAWSQACACRLGDGGRVQGIWADWPCLRWLRQVAA